MVDYSVVRRNMVESQVRPNRVTDPAIIEALTGVPRELFVPDPLRGVAYVDKNIDLGRGRYLMAPMVMARLLQVGEIRPGAIALDIGCASGYSTAVLARLCDSVMAVEEDTELVSTATTVLAELGVDNAAVIEGPLTQGYAKQAPYDLILFDGAIPRVPEAIAGQLAEGGRIVAVIDEGAGIGRGTVFTGHDGGLSGRQIFDAAIPLLPGFAGKPEFVF